MVKKMEDRIGTPDSSLDREMPPVSQNNRVRDFFLTGFRVVFSILKTFFFLVLLFIVGILSIPFAILASQVDNRLNSDRE